MGCVPYICNGSCWFCDQKQVSKSLFESLENKIFDSQTECLFGVDVNMKERNVFYVSTFLIHVSLVEEELKYKGEFISY